LKCAPKYRKIFERSTNSNEIRKFWPVGQHFRRKDIRSQHTFCVQIYEELGWRRERQVQSHGVVLGRRSRVSHTRSCQRALRDENPPGEIVRGTEITDNWDLFQTACRKYVVIYCFLDEVRVADEIRDGSWCGGAQGTREEHAWYERDQLH